MGLDMYLTKNIYVKRWDHEPDEEKHEVKVTKGGKPLEHVNPERISYITEEVAYWRKANAIHRWFVENIQNGKDDCGEYSVTIDQLKELLRLCKQVQANPDKAGEILPPTSGFFFGSTELDDWYFDDIANTVTVLEDILKHDFKGVFYYRSSW